MSGGPVFDPSGMLCGLVCASGYAKEGAETCFVTTLSPMLELSITANVDGEPERSYSLRKIVNMGIIAADGIESLNAAKPEH